MTSTSAHDRLFIPIAMCATRCQGATHGFVVAGMSLDNDEKSIPCKVAAQGLSEAIDATSKDRLVNLTTQDEQQSLPIAAWAMGGLVKGLLGHGTPVIRVSELADLREKPRG